MSYLIRLIPFTVMALMAHIAASAKPSVPMPYEPPVLEAGVPTTLELPADFKPPRNARRETLGFHLLWGVTLERQKGTIPIYIIRVEKGQVPGEHLAVGDVIVAVNGKALGKDGGKQFRDALGGAHRNGGFFWFTRWRAGSNKRCLVDLGTNMFDLTKTQTPGRTNDWRLGPLGVNGWCFHRRTEKGASDEARQILITAVDADGPCADKLHLRDIIIGAGGGTFTSDARLALASAIGEAEKTENKGRLALRVWREGNVRDVIIQLPVLGTYSETAPFDCAKTEKIIDNAVDYMKANADTLLKFEEKGWINYINGLGLLATGREDVMPLVTKLAHETILKDGEKLSVDHHVSMKCWWWSYKTLFLCEYYLRTNDKTVLPTIEEYATKIAMGQSGAGTWGHTYAARENTGYLHGHLAGYGAVNQQGLTMMVALPLAAMCGIENKEVMNAIQRGNHFFKFFIDKGTIPYGDHGAADNAYDDNGKSGAAAIFFDLMGNRHGATFFSDMVLASAPSGREQGHTGHFWSHLWGGIGVARGGDKSLQAFMKEMDPYFTLERQPNGRFVFQRNPGENGPKGTLKPDKDSTGARLLQLCAPRRALYITGRGATAESHLTDSRIEQMLRAGRLKTSAEARAELTKADILRFLSDPLPPTRAMAATAIEERGMKCVDDLIAMLDSDNKYARYGAATALRNSGWASETAARKLIGLMQSSTDVTFKSYAIEAFTSRDKARGLLAVAGPSIPVQMKMALTQSPDDPRKVLQQAIGDGLFYSGRARPKRGVLVEHGLDGVDRKLLISVVKEILTNENGQVRSVMSRWLYPKLTEDERGQLWGEIYQASQHIAPSGIMFASGNRTDGFKLMAHYKIKEGLDLAVWYLRYQKKHGQAERVAQVLKAIESYGAHAKRLIPDLESHIVHWRAVETRQHTLKDSKHPVNRTAASINKLKALPDEPKEPLVSIAKHLDVLNIEFPPKPIVLEAE